MAQQLFYQGKDGKFYPDKYGSRHNSYPQQQSGYNQTNTKKKRSGCKHRKYFNAEGVEQFLTTGWRKVNGNFITYKAVTTTRTILSDKGWFGSVFVTITNSATGEVNEHWGTMQKSTGKVVIDKIASVMNPKANNGGYVGSYLKK